MRRSVLWAIAGASLMGCGSPGKAQPAEVEIFWPDAAAVVGASEAAKVVLDAGVASADAQPMAEPVR